MTIIRVLQLVNNYYMDRYMLKINAYCLHSLLLILIVLRKAILVCHFHLSSLIHC